MQKHNVNSVEQSGATEQRNDGPLWIAGKLHKNNFITIDGVKTELKMSWAEGMVGVMPVFSTKEAAQKSEGQHVQLTEIEPVPKTD